MVQDLLVAIVNVGCHHQEVDALHSLMVVISDVSQWAVYVHAEGQGRHLQAILS